MKLNRRNFLRSAAAGGVTMLAAPAIVRAAGSEEEIRVGYLHTLAVDGHIWTAEQKGYWQEQGLKPTFTRFYTGLELFQAMVGGSLDMLATGAVVSNFPARGQGKVFLINNVEYATAQLWVNPAMGVNSFEDLKGKQIATSIGTTAHVFLDTALSANGIDPKSGVSIINQRMPDAVTAFISGAVPAVALWVPFNVQVKSQLQGAKMLVDASEFYPEAAIVGGWAARNDYFDERKDVLERVIKAWLPANKDLIEDADATLAMLQKEKYADVPIEDLREQYGAQKLFSAADWAKMYQDGTVATWLDRVTDFYVGIGGISDPVKAEGYFDPSLFLKQAG
ncbi:ABC transporter substrate-binding protein [Nitratireductor sp. ZSWI3]|uniref:ABC transporter substrate-binding protein n=1 Tax=Nitratireductor sp. ZSWI3 TaxID=2966359 RepID=UPI00214F7A45|nr:ABC transporter substrate-binding protein [Nitratireductor sp. ZSWI3]MCR4266682.1 ABC transporter substrate-binding protein [Nitratireductor sp. ZSWI3]